MSLLCFNKKGASCAFFVAGFQSSKFAMIDHLLNK